MAASSPSETGPTTLPPAPAGEQPRRRRPRPLIVLVAASLLIAGVGMAVVLRVRGDQFLAKPRFTVAELDVRPGSKAPAKAAPAPAQAAAWSQRIAERTDISARMLLAYAGAERYMRRTEPGCKISWATLAGVGRVESRHGEYGGAQVLADGMLSRPIIGVPLDGSSGLRAIRDTDGGALDGDPVWDHAVGAMQFVPSTWQRWALRANGDGRAPDPQNVDDAALASARYLCDKGGDLSTAAGWWHGVLAYNQSTRYGRDVFSGADAYARVSATG